MSLYICFDSIFQKFESFVKFPYSLLLMQNSHIKFSLLLRYLQIVYDLSWTICIFFVNLVYVTLLCKCWLIASITWCSWSFHFFSHVWSSLNLDKQSLGRKCSSGKNIILSLPQSTVQSFLSFPYKIRALIISYIYIVIPI